MLDQENNNKGIRPSDVKKLALECKSLNKDLSFESPIISEEKITRNIKVVSDNESLRMQRLFEYTVPADDKRDNLTESVKEKEIYNQIVADIEKEESMISEFEVIEEGIVDVIKNYSKKGLLTFAIVSQLLANNVVNAQQLQDAGVDPAKIEVAMDAEEETKTGRPNYYYWSTVKSIAADANQTEMDEKSGDLNRISHFTFYSSSNEYKFVNVPFKLTTSEDMAGSVKDAHLGYTTNYNKYNTKTHSDTTRGFRNNVSLIGTEDKEVITYTISDYPQQIPNQFNPDGKPLEFLGVQVMGYSPTNKSAFYNNKLANVLHNKQILKPMGTTFIPAHGKKAVIVKAYSAAMVLVYGEYVETPAVPQEDSLNVKFDNAFNYNSTDVKTDSEAYQSEYQKLKDYIQRNPGKKLTIGALGSSSQVPTNYPSLEGPKTIDANQQLAQDRAEAMVKQVMEDLIRDGIDPSVLDVGNIQGKIGSIEYANDAWDVEKYAPEQFVQLIINSK